MSEKSSYPLRLSNSLKKEVARIAKEDGVSINQFISTAVAEKVSAMKTEDFFKERAKRADLSKFEEILLRSGGEKPAFGDELE